MSDDNVWRKSKKSRRSFRVEPRETLLPYYDAPLASFGQYGRSVSEGNDPVTDHIEDQPLGITYRGGGRLHDPKRMQAVAGKTGKGLNKEMNTNGASQSVVPMRCNA
jgi:hypothetical protein